MVPIENLEHILETKKLSKFIAIFLAVRIWRTILMTFYLVHQRLVAGFLLQLGNVGYDHRNYQVQLENSNILKINNLCEILVSP